MKDEAYYRGLLSRSFDEELGQAESKALEKALLQSRELREESARLRNLREAFRSFPKPSDEAFTEAVMRQIEQSDVYRFPAYWLQWAAAASAAIILIAGISIYWSAGSLTAEALVGVSELSPEDAVTLLQAY
ncbi:MAG: hypothetical protein RIC19_01410 [Phaeodactylibacter sp.]|uniref:hypothetical protein n=1 Tax=Phaeodactylibacter sp. TaxID=1940289 RepID=UPI0032EF4DA8